MAANVRRRINLKWNVTKQCLSIGLRTHNTRIVVFSKRSENRISKNALPANVSDASQQGRGWETSLLPRRCFTQLVLASLSRIYIYIYIYIISKGKATFLSTFTVKLQWKAPALKLESLSAVLLSPWEFDMSEALAVSRVRARPPPSSFSCFSPQEPNYISFLGRLSE